MFDWISILLSPVIGAGAGSVFGKFFTKKDKGGAEAPPDNLAAVNRRLAQIREWQADAEELLKTQQRQITQLKRAFYLTRLFALLCLLVIAAAAAAWFYALRRLP